MNFKMKYYEHVMCITWKSKVHITSGELLHDSRMCAVSVGAAELGYVQYRMKSQVYMQ